MCFLKAVIHICQEYAGDHGAFCWEGTLRAMELISKAEQHSHYTCYQLRK